MKAARSTRLAGALGALTLICFALGFLAGRGADFTLDTGWLEPRPLDLLSVPEEQIERALLDSHLSADEIVDVSRSDLQFQVDGKASLLEVVAARGATALAVFVLGYADVIDAERVGAAICVAARYDHSSTVKVLLGLEQADPETLRCHPEGLTPSRLAKQSGHDGVSRLLAEQGF